MLPKVKLRFLRYYLAFSEYFIEFILFTYVLLSVYYLFTGSHGALANIVIGLTGVYIIGISLSVLFVTQLVRLFIGIHDNVAEIKEKAFTPDYTGNPNIEGKNPLLGGIGDTVAIVLVVSSILFTIINFSSKESSSGNSTVNTVSSVTTSTKSVNIADLRNNSGIYYDSNNQPYTGAYKGDMSDHSGTVEGNMVNGKFDGKIRYIGVTGRCWKTQLYKDGVLQDQ